MWKKAGCVFLILAGLIYIGGILFFSSHYYLNTSINGIPAGKKKPEYVYQKEKENADKYQLTIQELETEETVSHCLQIAGMEYYESVLKEQQAYKWPFRFCKEYKLHSDKVYEANEKSLQDQVAKLTFMNENRKKADAKLKYNEETKQYKVIPEKYGAIKDKEEAYNQIKEAVKSRKENIDLTPLYEKPKICTDTPAFTKAKKKLDKELSAQITFERGDTKVTLDADTIHDFLCWDKKYKTWISEEGVKSWVENHVSTKFNTVGKERTIHSPGSGKFTVSGGTYGYIVGVDSTTDDLIDYIKKGETVTIEPHYIQTGKIGNDYVDISLSDQHLWVVKDGKVKISSPLVSGNTSNGHGTKTGVYFVEYKTTNYTMRKYNAHVDYWMPFDTGEGVGMHDADWRSSFGGNIYRSNGSHGCINLPPSKAREIYHMVPTNYPVIVHW